MARTGPAGGLQRRIQQAIKAAYPRAFVFKVHGGPYQQAGIPDLLCCIDGHFFALEVKLPGGKHGLSPIQKAVINQIIDAGGHSTFVTSPSEAVAVIKGVLDG